METFWQTQPEYTLLDAAFLWLNNPPQSKIPDSDRRIYFAILNMFLSAIHAGDLEVTGGIKYGLIIRSSWMQTESRQPDKYTVETRVSRRSLKALAEKKGVKPVFLFPEEQRPEASSLKNDEKDGETPVKVSVQSMKEDVDGLLNASMHYEKKAGVSKAAVEHIDKSPTGVKSVPGRFNTIKEFNPRICALTYCGVESSLTGKSVPIIRELLLNPFKEFPATTFTSTTEGESIRTSGDAEYDEENEVIQITAQEKETWQLSITVILENIEDLKARLVVEENLDKKSEIETKLDVEEKRLSGLKKMLAEHKGWVNEKGKLRFRGKKTDEGGNFVVKQKKEYKNVTDGVSKLCRAAIKQIQDENLKTHLTKCIRYGKNIRYIPTENIEWMNIK